jgi:hypothetical protein
MASDLLEGIKALPAKQNCKDMLRCMFDVISSTTYSHCSEEQTYSSSTEVFNLASTPTMPPYDASSFMAMSEDMYDEEQLIFDDTCLPSYDSSSHGLSQLGDLLI